MKSIKKLDYFRKTKDDLERPTTTGFCFSILTIFFIIGLSYTELTMNSNAPLSKKVYIKSGDNETSYFVLNLDIMFENVPCAALTLMKDGVEGLDTVSVYSGINFQRISNDSIRSVIEKEYIDEHIMNDPGITNIQLKKLLTGLRHGEKCRAYGEILVHKIPNRLIFNHNLKKDHMKKIKAEYRELYDKINLSHKILKFTFTSAAQQNLILGNENIEIDALKGTNFHYDVPISCTYYLKALPISTLSGQPLENEQYQYSHHEECEEPINNDELNAEIYIGFETSPISIAYKKEQSNSLFGIFVIISGISCGVFVIMRILHSVCIKMLRGALLED